VKDVRRGGRSRMSKMERGGERGGWDHGPEGFKRPVPATTEEGLSSWTIAPNFLKSTPGILKNEEGQGVKPHPIVRVLGMVLILSALGSLASWGGPPTTPGARASNLQPPHPLDVESHRSLQTAVVHALPQQYVAHEPIVIEDNADFAAFGFPGEGSPSNPYVIEGLNITANKTLIYIEETTVHFYIHNNLLNSLTGEHDGIYLKHVTHGTIDSNIISNCKNGINLHASEKNGIWLYPSDQNTIAHNTLSQNKRGIFLWFSGKNTMFHNTVSECEAGIALYHSGYSTMSHNTVEGGGIGLYESGHSTVTHNTVSECGAGITLESISGDPLDSGQNTVAHNTVSECEVGIKLEYSDQNIMSNNTVSNCGKGIYLYDSKQNTLVGNQLVNNYLVIELYLRDRWNAYITPYIWSVEHYVQATVAENMVNGHPLVFWQNVRGGTVPPGAGQIFLLKSTMNLEIAPWPTIPSPSVGWMELPCMNLEIAPWPTIPSSSVERELSLMPLTRTPWSIIPCPSVAKE